MNQTGQYVRPNNDGQPSTHTAHWRDTGPLCRSWSSRKPISRRCGRARVIYYRMQRWIGTAWRNCCWTWPPEQLRIRNTAAKAELRTSSETTLQGTFENSVPQKTSRSKTSKPVIIPYLHKLIGGWDHMHSTLTKYRDVKLKGETRKLSCEIHLTRNIWINPSAKTAAHRHLSARDFFNYPRIKH